MLRDAAVAIIGKRLGNRTDLDADIVTQMQLAQIELEQGEILPWFLHKTDKTIQNDGTDFEIIDLPTDFIAEFEGSKLYIYVAADADPLTELWKNDYETIQSGFSDQSTADPTHYSLKGSKIYLGPQIPTAQLTFQWDYWAQDVLLTSDIENNWLKYAPELILSLTGIKMTYQTRDEDARKLFKESYTESYDNLLKTHEARQHANFEYQMEYGKDSQ